MADQLKLAREVGAILAKEPGMEIGDLAKETGASEEDVQHVLEHYKVDDDGKVVKADSPGGGGFGQMPDLGAAGE